MGLYHLYSHNVEIKYKSYLLSKAAFFTFVTTFMNIVLPFIVAYRSRGNNDKKNTRGFWLKSHSYYEKPVVHSTFNYLLVASTEDPTQLVICGNAIYVPKKLEHYVENCAEIQIQEYTNAGGNTDIFIFKVNLNVEPILKIKSILLILEIDFRIQAICELQMQALAIIDKEFSVSPSEFHHYGDLDFYQTSHLPCLDNIIDTRYNTSLFNWSIESRKDVVDFILENYFERSVITNVKTQFSRTEVGYTGNFNINVHLRVPETQIKYQPSVMQELRWAWPQYLSLVAVFYWIFNRLKKIVFNRRLLMAWEIIPWKHN